MPVPTICDNPHFKLVIATPLSIPTSSIKKLVIQDTRIPFLALVL